MDGLSDNEALLLELKAPKQYQVGVEILCVGLNDTNATAKFKSKSSGSYRFVCFVHYKTTLDLKFNIIKSLKLLKLFKLYNLIKK